MPGREAARQYRLRARHCLEIAGDLSDPKEKLAMLDMAQAWSKLAEQAKKNGRADLVYETPERPRKTAARAFPASLAHRPTKG